MSPDKKNHVKVYIFSILIPLGIGFLSAMLTKDGMKSNTALSHPPFNPPGILFTIVWAILYVLMGISAAMIYNSRKSPERKKACWLYGVQLTMNFFWSIWFFNTGWRLFAFIWLLLLLLFVIAMYFAFDKISHTAAYLQIPYILWLCFAAYLNFGTWFLNK